MPKDLIQQLSHDDLWLLESLCQPFASDAPVELDRTKVLSMLNEIRYHRGRRANEGILEIRSLVSMRDGKPYVTLHFGSVDIQLSTAEAIEHARRILHVACGADADAYLVNFLTDRIGLDQAARGQILQDFRAYRQDVLGEQAPDDLDTLKKSNQ